MKQTPSQTVGPYFAYGLTPEQYLYDFKSLAGNQMVNPIDRKNAITIVGKVFDGEGAVIPDAMIEIWQNDGENPLFGRFGTGTDPENRFVFHTIKPVAVNGQAPHLSVIVFMRGQLIHSYTRLYFSDEVTLNERDDVLNSIPAERRNTLIASQNGSVYEFNIRMQGEGETVFFEI
ncbi:protocatechuate 3,4-dioxygenase subunit alpha [Runella slithyformis]|uniref:Protocatechuate 3,4-dioxygenase, alpha subunit n=1 Tax=Runella slithyformis (strain ATCC 29530 / DSM 19594 / LMG 11500 / NCIMB 11436 / LSU 4) TaxID=761193 RepID=A0A7U3ZGU7_RUNSL|nr:protocatechuate 3,4-dioxygenase subunit alpha [Runella slithyformis]AEI46973.1 protocatechuate 3,4-dioxygenase, alpha subunit [Runella slithyformis DSM 19594]